MKSIWASIGATALLSRALAQFVPAPTDLTTEVGYGNYTVRYKEVPSGICETVEGVKSYSGYVDVDDDQHLFFYFIEARTDPSASPLTLWLNGGPGDPSMIGLFSENGPCWIDYDGNVQFNEFSWNNVSNMLYLDQPTDTGFSYSIPINAYTSDNGYIVELPDATCPDYAPTDSCGTLSSSNAGLTANSSTAAAPNVYRALQGFLGVFPEYATNGVHIATESYGGHYGPVFAEYILEQNDKSVTGTIGIDLKSLAVGNGWFDPLIQYQAYYNFTVSPGNTFGFAPFNESQEEQMYNALYGEGNCVDQLLDCNTRGLDEICSAADNLCYDEVEYLYDTVTGRDEYDLRELSPDPFPYTTWVTYLNKPEVLAAVGACTNFSYSVSNLGTGTVATAFGTTGDDARQFDIVARNRRLVEKGVYVVHYAGDADYNCNWIGGEAVAEAIDASGFSNSGYEDLTVSDTVYGAVKQAGKYGFVRIYDAGHSVPFYKPVAALALFERIINRTDIATGLKKANDSYVSVGPAKSTYRNGNSTIQEEVVDASCTYDVLTNLQDCSGEYSSSAKETSR